MKLWYFIVDECAIRYLVPFSPKLWAESNVAQVFIFLDLMCATSYYGFVGGQIVVFKLCSHIHLTRAM
jgi:hypothetical protein